MMQKVDKIRCGIVGYGRLGRGVELALRQQPDMEVQAIYTRRPTATIQPADPAVPVHAVDVLDAAGVPVDVLLLCGGSRTDLVEQTPYFARTYNVVDSYDHHARMSEHVAAVDRAARAGQHTAVVAAGWDPGLFSLQRVFGEAFLPQGRTYTFWGEGVSQGHSDAIRRLPGVVDAVQYTVPQAHALAEVRAGGTPDLSAGQAHRRVCFVVLAAQASPEEVRSAIVTMPDYFAPYTTEVHFISLEELHRDHAQIPHGGHVLRIASTAEGAPQVMEASLKLGSNPEFTASVLVAYARAAHRLSGRGDFGAKTVFDIAPALLSPRGRDELVRDLL